MEQSYDETQQWEGSLTISEGCWCRKCKDMFQSPDWFVLSVHLFVGGMHGEFDFIVEELS